MGIGLKQLKRKEKNWANRLFGRFSYKKLQEQEKNIETNFNDFAKEEEQEVKELVGGQQNLNRFFRDSKRLFTYYFVPTKANDYRPKILHPRKLWWLALILVSAKFLLVFYLFVIYHQQAEMSTPIVNQLYALTNETRLANNVEPLNLNITLSQSAQSKAEDMVINNYFNHTSPDGRHPWDFVNRQAYPYLLVGENLAMNFITAPDVHAALMASPSHQKNILNPKYTDIGLAVISGKINGQTTNVLVQIFAYKQDSQPSGPVATTTEFTSIFKSASIPEPTVASPDKILVASENSATPAEETAVTKIPSSYLEDTGPKIGYPLISEDSATPAEETAVTKIPSSYLEDTGPKIGDPLINKELIIDSSPDLGIVEPLALESGIIPAETLVELENNSNEGEIYVYNANNRPLNRASALWYWSKIFYIAFLILLIITLLINIFVRPEIQHYSIITQTVLLIILVIALFLFDFNFIKEINSASFNILIF